MLTNSHYMVRGQLRSPNIVPFHMLGIVSWNSNSVFKMHHFSDIRLQKCSDLENQDGVLKVAENITIW